ACGHGRSGSWIPAIFGIPVSRCGYPLFTGHVGRYAFTFTAAQPLAALVVLLLTAINYLSVQLSGAIQVLLTSLKVGAIVLIVVGGILLGTKHSQAAQLDIPSVSAPLAMGTIGVLLTALVPAMWAYNGFNDL